LEQAAEVIGLPARFLSKILSLNPGRHLTALTLGPVLQGFGVKLLMVDDEEALARFEHRIKRRDPKVVRSVAVHFQITSRHVRRIGAKGGANSRKYMTRRQASQLGRKAALARWSKWKAAAA
jgi:hypothetical protein